MKKIIINLFIVVFILLIFEVLAFIFFKREFYNIQNSTDFDFNSQSTYYKKVIKLKDMYNNSIFEKIIKY